MVLSGTTRNNSPNGYLFRYKIYIKLNMQELETLGHKCSVPLSFNHSLYHMFFCKELDLLVFYTYDASDYKNDMQLRCYFQHLCRHPAWLKDAQLYI
jgi:hypothetical protein